MSLWLDGCAASHRVSSDTTKWLFRQVPSTSGKRQGRRVGRSQGLQTKSTGPDAGPWFTGKAWALDRDPEFSEVGSSSLNLAHGSMSGSFMDSPPHFPGVGAFSPVGIRE